MNRNVLVISLMIIFTGCASSPNAIIPQTVKVERKAGWVDCSSFDGSLYRPGTETLAFLLSAVEQDRIAYVADSVGFWSLPFQLQSIGGAGDAANFGENSMRVKTPTMDNTITWQGNLDFGAYGAAGDRAMRLQYLIDSIIHTRPLVAKNHQSKGFLH